MAINYPNDTDVKIVRDKDGLVTSLTDPTGTSSMVYYPSTWLKTFTNGAGKTVTYEYNGVGDVSKLTAPGGTRWFTYGYTSRNQLSWVKDTYNTTLSSFIYDNGGRLSRITRPGDGYTQYAYNARDWLLNVCSRTSSNGELYTTCYCYGPWAGLRDHVGNPLGKVEFLAEGAQYGTTYWYDGVDRLTREKRRICCGATDYDNRYGYDQVGNRTTTWRDGVTTNYAYDNNDKLISASDGSSFGYDGAGNMTSVSGPLGSWTLTYDDAGRLSQVIYPTGTDTFGYNALGERMRLTANGVVTRYVYHGDRVLEETDDAGVVQVRYATANGSYYTPLLQRWTGVSRFPLYDTMGSVRRLIDSTDTITDEYNFDAFGTLRSSSGTTPNPYRFGGEWGYITDPSGLLQLGTRFYP